MSAARDRRGPGGGDREGPGGRRRRVRPGGPRGSADEGARTPRDADVEEVRRAVLAQSPRPAASVAVRGTLRRAEKTRALLLDADDGSSWELLLPAGWVLEAEPGVRVTVSGDVVGDAASGGSGAPVLRVRSLSRGS